MAQRNPDSRPKLVKPRPAALTITHPNAAGIDISSASHYRAVPPDRDDEPVREFPSFTADLNALADWQKARTQMNVQLANVISEVVGETGQKILRAIVKGERDGQVLAALKNSRIHASADEIAASVASSLIRRVKKTNLRTPTMVRWSYTKLR